MKMSDVFELPVSNQNIATKLNPPVRLMEAAAHAINCHDDLVVALEDMLLLRNQVLRMESTGYELLRVSAARTALTRARGEA